MDRVHEIFIKERSAIIGGVICNNPGCELAIPPKTVVECRQSE